MLVKTEKIFVFLFFIIFSFYAYIYFNEHIFISISAKNDWGVPPHASMGYDPSHTLFDYMYSVHIE